MQPLMEKLRLIPHTRSMAGYFRFFDHDAVPARSPTLMDRALGSYLGLAVGDALGSTVEFMTAGEIAAVHKVHRNLIGGGWLQLKPGQVTDDTQMALALGRAIIESGGWNIRAIADAFVHWMHSKPVDIGNTCRRGIRRYLAEGTLCAVPSQDDGGNGAAMRNLPAVLASLHNEAGLLERSLEQARFTHYQTESDAATVALARMTRTLILGGGRDECARIANELVEQHRKFRFIPWPGNTTGYIVDTVQTVFDAFFNTSDFEECLVRVVNRGGDADTTGAIAGQLAGALYGLDAIPSRWLKRLDPNVAAAIRKQTPDLLTVAESVREMAIGHLQLNVQGHGFSLSPIR